METHFEEPRMTQRMFSRVGFHDTALEFPTRGGTQQGHRQSKMTLLFSSPKPKLEISPHTSRTLSYWTISLQEQSPM